MALSLAQRAELHAPAGAPLVEVEYIARVITTRAQTVTILDDLTFTVPAQSLFAINGPSGSGKSTLLNLLTGIDRPTSGKIVFSGREMRKMSENKLARWRGQHVGVVFQFFQLIADAHRSGEHPARARTRRRHPAQGVARQAPMRRCAWWG